MDQIWVAVTMFAFAAGLACGIMIARNHSADHEELIARGFVRYELKAGGKPTAVWCIDGKPVEEE